MEEQFDQREDRVELELFMLPGRRRWLLKILPADFLRDCGIVFKQICLQLNFTFFVIKK